MIRRLLVVSALLLSVGAMVIAQSRNVPRPAALPAGQQPPGESAAPDGYAPLPQ